MLISIILLLLLLLNLNYRIAWIVSLHEKSDYHLIFIEIQE